MNEGDLKNSMFLVTSLGDDCNCNYSILVMGWDYMLEEVGYLLYGDYGIRKEQHHPLHDEFVALIVNSLTNKNAWLGGLDSNFEEIPFFNWSVRFEDDGYVEVQRVTRTHMHFTLDFLYSVKMFPSNLGDHHEQ